MARFEIPYQNISVSLPDEGMAFRGEPGNGENLVFVRRGNQLLYIPKEEYQGNFGSLPVINPGQEGLAHLTGGRAATRSSFSEISSVQHMPGEVITQRINPENPQGIIRESNLAGVLTKGPSTAEVAARLGVTPQQLIREQGPLAEAIPTPTGLEVPPSVLSRPDVREVQQTVPPTATTIPRLSPKITIRGTNKEVQLGMVPPSARQARLQAQRKIQQPIGGVSTPSVVQNLPSTGVSDQFPTQDTTQVPELAQTPESIQTLEPTFLDQIHSLLKEFGITPASPNQNPINAFADTYKQLVEQFGLDKTRKEHEALIEKQTNEIATVNENPWISEGLRSRKITAIQNKYENRLSLLQSMYDRDQRNAQFIAEQSLKISHQGQELNKDMLFKVIDLAEKEVQARRSERREERREEATEERFGRTLREREREFESREKRLKRQFEERLKKPTTAEIKESEIQKTEKRLSQSRGKDGFSDPSTYLEERRRSRMHPTEFDERFGNYLSSREQKRLNIKGGEKGGVGQFITPEFLSGLGIKPKNIQTFIPIIQTYRDAGFSDDEIIKLMGRK